MPQFDISSFGFQLFWLIVIFGSLYLLISKFIAPKAEIILTTRNLYLDTNVNEASDYSAKIKALKASRQLKQDETHEHVQNIQKGAIENLESEFTFRKQELMLELKSKTEKSLNEIDASADNFHKSEPEACINLAAFIIEKITNKPVNLTLLQELQKQE